LEISTNDLESIKNSLTIANDLDLHYKGIMILSLILFTFFSFAESIKFPPKENFFFGVANAPVQVEDQLFDTWLNHARVGKVRAFKNTPQPDKKIEFWTHPEIEIDLAHELGVEVFRLGIDWSRIVHYQIPYMTYFVDQEAISRYQEIMRMIKAKNMKIMLTLFHHSEPEWTLKEGSWSNPKMIQQFSQFVQSVMPSFVHEIDYVITFNEAQLYTLMTAVQPIWPSYISKNNPLGLFSSPLKQGIFDKSLKHISIAHKQTYSFIKSLRPNLPIGIAHNVGYYQGKNFLSSPFAEVSWQKLNFQLLDLISAQLDFMGLNYYGVEKLSGIQIKLDPGVEYSDSGRGISPFGLYQVVKRLEKRYGYLKLPYIITENGIADASDKIRPLYVIEHLKVLQQLMKEGISILGYIHWTLTDNFEWSDGYCPKFGLVAIDRSSMRRLKRDSFYFYQSLIKTRTISDASQEEAWKQVLLLKNSPRPMCRSQDGVTALDDYRFEKFKAIDWRFTKQPHPKNLEH
jgi:beta-glucosidase/6-phospho-beta-glucosidase/beta-galactosidase